jgi:hydrogenase/urease accessory protein HupE
MKPFLKVLLLVVAALIAIKLLPLTVAVGCLVALLLAGLAFVGVSVLALVVGLGIVIAAVLAPIWVPVLAVVGIIALIKRTSHRPAATATA